MLNCKLFANYDETLFANYNFHDIIIKKCLGVIMTGCVALRNGVNYVHLSYYDRHHKRKDKFISTGLSGRGAKQKATAMIESLIDRCSYLKKSDAHSKIADYLTV